LVVGDKRRQCVVGAIFIARGAQEQFMYGVEGVIGPFGSMGIPMPALVRRR
jgi:uncharacterized membrane protein YphA (DoxX/SURF4 family)